MTDRYQPMFGFPISKWHLWFAWRPVQTIDRGWVWLRPVWRRRIELKPFLQGGPSRWFQYVFDLDG
jgi:hypothetical protein